MLGIIYFMQLHFWSFSELLSHKFRVQSLHVKGRCVHTCAAKNVHPIFAWVAGELGASKNCSKGHKSTCLVWHPCRTKSARKSFNSKTKKSIQGEVIYPPPSRHFWPKGNFPGEGGGGVYFEAPRGRNFIRPPPFIHPPPLGGYFQGWGGGGVKKSAP